MTLKPCILSSSGVMQVNNFGRLYRFELKKIFTRKLTAIALAGIMALLIAINAAEVISLKKSPGCDDRALVGRVLDDSLFDEMRAGITPSIVTNSLGEEEIEYVTYDDPAYRHLFQFILQCAGNTTRAYDITEARLSKTFDDIIDHAYEDARLSAGEISYWQARREALEIPPLYGRTCGWSNSIVNLYISNLFILIAVGATVSGIFADEYSLRTDAVVFASALGKRKLALAKLLAGCTAAAAEAAVILGVNTAVQFALYGADDAKASIQLIFGPSLSDMTARKAFFVCTGIILIISIFYSLFAMFVSQVFRNTTAPLALLAVIMICSMLNPPGEYRIIAQIASYMPATFPGSWTFTDYRLLAFFGLKLNIFQVLPLLYSAVSVILGLLTCRSYGRTQIGGR